VDIAMRLKLKISGLLLSDSYPLFRVDFEKRE
jgi:hypothetical protein